MKVSEIAEGVTQIWGTKKGKTVRKYRCTSGPRKGRQVAKPSTCNAPKRVQSSLNIKKTKHRIGKAMNVKIGRTKRAGKSAPRTARLNAKAPSRRIKPRSNKSRKIK
jgi:hypothetical protein